MEDKFKKTINDETSENVVYSELNSINNVGIRILEYYHISHLEEEIKNHLPIIHNVFFNNDIYDEVTNRIVVSKKLNTDEKMGLLHFFSKYLKSLECFAITVDSVNDKEVISQHISDIIKNNQTPENFCIKINDSYKGTILEINLTAYSVDANPFGDFYKRRTDKENIVGRNWERIEDSLGIRFNKSKDKEFFLEKTNNLTHIKTDIFDILKSNIWDYLAKNHVVSEPYKVTITLFDSEGYVIESVYSDIKL